MNDKPASYSSGELGCGTLFIIALIVMYFSGSRETQQLGTQVDNLNQKIDRLEKKLDALSEKLGPQPSPTPK